MLEKASGLNCQASNFLKTFSGLSNAVSLNLLEEFAPNVALTNMIQNLNRFLLEKISDEFRQMLPSQPGPSAMDQVLETQARASMRCAQCTNETIRGGKNFVNELVYPAKHVMMILSANLRQLNLYESYLTGFEMAPSGEAIALADSNSHIHLWGSPSKVHFPEYSNPTETADHNVPPPPAMDWNPDT